MKPFLLFRNTRYFPRWYRVASWKPPGIRATLLPVFMMRDMFCGSHEEQLVHRMMSPINGRCIMAGATRNLRRAGANSWLLLRKDHPRVRMPCGATDTST